TALFQVVEPVYKKHLLDDNANGASFTPNDPKFTEQWSYNNTGQGNGTAGKDIKLVDAWNIETGKPNVIVAVHDMGIQLNHPDLAQNIAVGKSYNFIDNNDTIVPGYHGTHTAGTIAAVNNNGIGVSGIAGGDGSVNSGIRLMSVQIFKGNQSAGLAEGFVFAADNGAAISSNSWAYDIENIYELSVMDAIDYFITNGGGNSIQGGLVIFASGNKSQTIKYFPSAYDRVICVSATNNRDTKANYSTFGSWVDISAPGGDYNAFGASQILSTTTNDGYAGDHGTSMACPHVSGVAALIASKLSGKASASDVRDILLSTTDNIDALNPNYIGLLGTGRLNAYKAMQKAETINNGLSVLPIDSVWGVNNCNTINIYWNKNINNNDIIVAYSNKNDVGFLTNGTSYNIGDKLMGEGRIIYKGNASSFTMNNNDSLFHYFKVWSVDAPNNYSFGKTVELVSQAYVNTSGTYIQNFDFPPYFPTIEWRTINYDNDISWIHTAADTSNTGAGDAYSMAMYNYNYNSLLGAVDVLTSPLINIQNTDSLQLSFWYAYKYRNTGLPIADSLEALVSTDCGLNYTSLWKKGGIDLATINSTTDSIFYPFGIDKWKNVTIDLTSFKTNNKLMFAFRSVNGKGNNLFLDKVGVDIRYKTDVSLLSLQSPQNTSCDTIIIPQIIIKNVGNDVLNSLQIDYSIDGGSIISTTWNGALAKDATTAINLNQSTVLRGHHTIAINTSKPNTLADNFVLNDTIKSSFFISLITKMPINEGFEGASFPPPSWYVHQNPKDAISWVKYSLAGKNSANSCFMQNYYYDNDGRIDDLITPIFESYNNGDSCFLSFDYAHATRNNPTTNSDFDTLEISYSKDCGNSWTKIWKKGGNNLQTINQTQSYGNEFIPQANQWKKDSVLVSGIFNSGDKIQVRFKNIEYFGNNIYLDNINLYSKYTLPILIPAILDNYRLQFNDNPTTVANYWNTLTETNTSLFNVQRSFDGKDVVNIGRVVANG
ncbi:MAG: S8 family serine peptidase, partial [Chitinophagaceae bacterium]